MSLAENKNGHYPIMQNPGVPGVDVESNNHNRTKIVGSRLNQVFCQLTNFGRFDRVVNLNPHGRYSLEDELEVLEETTFRT